MNNIDWNSEAEVNALLRKGLLLANMPSEEVPSDEFDYSPRFRQWERKLLADPFGYVRKKNRPIWQRALRIAAVLILTCALTLGALMATTPGVRAAVMRWFVETFQTHDAFRFTDEQAAPISGDKTNKVIWMREDKGTAFLLISFEPCETLIRIAEGVALID